MNAADFERRVVLPQWLPFAAASIQREACVFASPRHTIDFGPTTQAFGEALEMFRADPIPHVGAELMGIAQVLGHSDIARDLADFVLAQPNLGDVVHNEARGVLGYAPAKPREDERTLLHRSKHRVRAFPHDALAWIEQARLYTITGHADKAQDSVLAALHLAPGDRYITRCAIRCFVHFGQWDAAFHHAQRAYARNPDPLIFGPLLSVSSKLGKLPPRLKNHLQAALNTPDPLLHSETLEAAGTLELMAGADKRAKPFFRHAWKDPTNPVIGHSQWILREHLPTLASDQKIDFWSSKEAVSWLRYSMLDFAGAVTDSTAWGLEEPYSRGPHMLGSTAACMVGNFDEAVAIAERGLLANPGDEILLNNLAFAHLRAGNMIAGQEALSPLLGKLDDKAEIALPATYGLLLMRQGDQTGGERYYGEAIKRALEQKNRRLAVRATLNLMVSKIDTAKTIDVGLLKHTQAALSDINDPSCLGAATVIADKLASSDLTGSDDLSHAAREFSTAVAQAREKFRSSVVANLLKAAPPQSASSNLHNLPLPFNQS